MGVMKVHNTALRDVKLLTPQRFSDDRGWFAEVFNTSTFSGLGIPAEFVQENQSRSSRGVLRGLHYQLGQPQGKLLRVLSGEIWDVAVDLRRDSPDFRKHAAFVLKPLTADGELQLLWIPEGFAHGFLVLSEQAEVLYKTTAPYYPAGERTIRWDDPTLAIPWPLHDSAGLNSVTPSVSAKDAAGSLLVSAELP